MWRERKRETEGGEKTPSGRERGGKGNQPKEKIKRISTELHSRSKEWGTEVLHGAARGGRGKGGV